MKNQIYLKLMCFISFLMMMQNSFGQVVYAEPDEFKEIKKRTLLVQLLEADTKYTEDLKNKIEKAKKAEDKEKLQKELDEINQFISDYNTFIKNAVDKYWNLNSKIEYKTISEIKKLRDAGSKQYTVLFYSESSSGKTDAYGFKFFPNLTIPTLNYSRIESGAVKIDYSFFIPWSSNGKFTYGNMILSMVLMKNHIAEIEKIKKKKYTFLDYAGDAADKNCAELKDKTIYMNKANIHDKTDEKELKDKYTNGKLEFASEDDIVKSIESEEDMIYSFVIPSTIVGGSTGGVISVSSARITFYRCFINVKTGAIYTCKGTKMGEFNDSYFRPKEVGAIGDCK